MNDLITAATSGLFVEVGKIIEHMKAQQERIADLERQLAEASDPVEFPADGRNDEPAEAAFWRFDSRKKGYGRWKGAPQSERDAFKAEYRAALAATQAADTDKVREAIKYSAGLRIAIENAASGYGEFIDAGLAETIGKEVVTFLNFTMAAQAPVREVPEQNEVIVVKPWQERCSGFAKRHMTGLAQKAIEDEITELRAALAKRKQP